MGETARRPLLSLTIKPKTKADQERLARGVAALTAEDPKMSATSDAATGEAVIAGMSELHLEVIVDRLRREFGVEASLGRPTLAEMFGYATDLGSRTQGRGVFAMQFGGYQAVNPAESQDAGSDSMVGAPRKPMPSLRDSSVALPLPKGDD